MNWCIQKKRLDSFSLFGREHRETLSEKLRRMFSSTTRCVRGGQENGMMGNIISFLLHQTQGPPVRKISEIINFEDRFIKGTPGSLYKQSDVGIWGWHVYMDPTAPCVVIHKYSCFIDHDKHCSPLTQCLSVGQRKLYNQQKSRQIWY